MYYGFDYHHSFVDHHFSDAGTGGPGGPLAPPIFGRSVNPIPTGEGRLSPPITPGTPNVFHLPASLHLNQSFGDRPSRTFSNQVGTTIHTFSFLLSVLILLKTYLGLCSIFNLVDRGIY